MNNLWVLLQNKALVSKVVLMAVPGLDMELFKAKEVLYHTCTTASWHSR